MAEKIIPAIVEGVMYRVLDEIGRVASNAGMRAWGTGWGGEYRPIVIGQVSVSINPGHNGFDALLSVVYGGKEVSTYLDSKREFYHAFYPDEWDAGAFVGWAESVFMELARAGNALRKGEI